MAQIFSKDRQYILEADFLKVNLDSIANNLRQLRNVRWYKGILKRILVVYETSEAMNEELADQIFEWLLESAGHDKDRLEAQVETALPVDLDECMAAIEEGRLFVLRERVEEATNFVDVGENMMEEEGDDLSP